MPRGKLQSLASGDRGVISQLKYNAGVTERDGK